MDVACTDSSTTIKAGFVEVLPGQLLHQRLACLRLTGHWDRGGTGGTGGTVAGRERGSREQRQKVTRDVSVGRLTIGSGSLAWGAITTATIDRSGSVRHNVGRHRRRWMSDVNNGEDAEVG